MNKINIKRERFDYFQEWKDRISSFLNNIGQLTTADTDPDSAKQIHWPLDEQAHMAEVIEVAQAREQFHLAILEIIVLKNSGDLYEARMRFIDLDVVISHFMTALEQMDLCLQKMA